MTTRIDFSPNDQLGTQLPVLAPRINLTDNVPTGATPVVTLLSPTVGPLAGAALLSISVTDAALLGKVLIFARNDNLSLYEVVWDGSSYGPRYPPATSTRFAIATGFTWNFTRSGGWPDGPLRIIVVAFDSNGLSVVAEFDFTLTLTADVFVPSSTLPAPLQLLRDEDLAALTEDVELNGTDGDQVFVFDVDGVMSDVKSAWLQVKGEWFLNLDEGLDWYGIVFAKPTDLGAIRKEFKRIALTCPGVVDLPTFVPTLDKANRTLAATYAILFDNGQVVAGSATLSPASGSGE